MLRRIIALNNRVTMRCFDNESVEVVLEEAEKGLMRILFGETFYIKATMNLDQP